MTTIDPNIVGFIKVYGKRDFKGYNTGFKYSASDLEKHKGHGFLGFGNWNKEINSVEVRDGVWVLCSEKNFGGIRSRELWPGNFISDVRSLGLGEDTIQSLQLVRRT